MTAAAEPAAFLRAYLQHGEDAPGTPGQVTSPGDQAPLVHSAFAMTARRMFAPAWTRAQAVQYVAAVREALSQRPGLIDPRAAEHELRRALGDTTAPAHSPLPALTAQLIILKAMTVSLQLDRHETDNLFSQPLMKPGRTTQTPGREVTADHAPGNRGMIS